MSVRQRRSARSFAANRRKARKGELTRTLAQRGSSGRAIRSALRERQGPPARSEQAAWIDISESSEERRPRKPEVPVGNVASYGAQHKTVGGPLNEKRPQLALSWGRQPNGASLGAKTRKVG
jgi:hypothetical protein